MRKEVKGVSLVHNFTCTPKQVEAYSDHLQGRVQFPTGGDSPRLLTIIGKTDLVKLQYRQYSLDERRINNWIAIHGFSLLALMIQKGNIMAKKDEKFNDFDQILWKLKIVWTIKVPVKARGLCYNKSSPGKNY